MLASVKIPGSDRRDPIKGVWYHRRADNFVYPYTAWRAGVDSFDCPFYRASQRGP